jgi:hypothetical protein
MRAIAASISVAGAPLIIRSNTLETSSGRASSFSHGNLVDLIETDSTGSIKLNGDTWKGPTYRRANLLLGTARIDVARHLAGDVDGPVAFRGHLRFPLFPLIMSS